MINNIPTELKAYRQFVCWKLEEREGTKPTKIPYCPQTGYPASVTNPNHWATFEEAKFACQNGGYSGIGFVLTENDPFTFIDLDKTNDPVEFQRQQSIYNTFNSYAELSPSGQGLHIIVKGKIPNGRRRSCVEIYANERYMTMTGNVYNNVPISERQALLSILWEEMGKGSKYIQYDGTTEEKNTDQEILDMAANASNGDVFKMFFDGSWTFRYHSQSEADFAFVDIIAFYTQNKNQIRRIFLNSPLGQRDKAKRPDYFRYMVDRAFDRQLPPINLELLNIEMEAMILAEKTKKLESERKEVSTAVDIPLSGLTLPPGLMGDIANYVYNSSFRPVPEIALATAIGIMAGLCGRQYNISDQGLNMYILLVAKTGRGKEAIASKSSELMNYITAALPAAVDFIGPGDFGSGQGLIRHLSDNPLSCAFSVVGEFGIKMQQYSDPRPGNSMGILKAHLLDLFHKSGKHSTFRPTVYSDKEKNTKTIQSPSLTIVGETTPALLYDNMDETVIASGLLPRFLTIEYLGERVNPNYNSKNVKPSPDLLNHLFELTNKVLMLGNAKTVVEVECSPDADKLQREFDIYCTRKINDKNVSEAVSELWNRSHIKALRLAALIAVGVNNNFPVIQADMMKWAINFVRIDTERVMWRFDKGKVGKNTESGQTISMMKVIKEYITSTYEDCAGKYDKGAATKKLYENKIITYAYIQRRLVAQTHFKDDRLGATNAIKKMIQSLMESGAISEVPKKQLLENFKTTARCFIINDSSLLEE